MTDLFLLEDLVQWQLAKERKESPVEVVQVETKIVQAPVEKKKKPKIRHYMT